MFVVSCHYLKVLSFNVISLNQAVLFWFFFLWRFIGFTLTRNAQAETFGSIHRNLKSYLNEWDIKRLTKDIFCLKEWQTIDFWYIVLTTFV